MHGHMNVKLVFGHFIWQIFTLRFRLTNHIFNTLESVSTALRHTVTFNFLIENVYLNCPKLTE